MQDTRWWGVLPVCKGAVGVFYNQVFYIELVGLHKNPNQTFYLIHGGELF